MSNACFSINSASQIFFKKVLAINKCAASLFLIFITSYFLFYIPWCMVQTLPPESRTLMVQCYCLLKTHGYVSLPGIGLRGRKLLYASSLRGVRIQELA